MEKPQVHTKILNIRRAEEDAELAIAELAVLNLTLQVRALT